MTIAFDRVADIYDETRALKPAVMAQLVQAIEQMGQATPGTRFFEPGVGTGRIALPLLERGYAYTGVDISEPMMEKLRQKAQDVPGQLTLVNADVTALTFADGLFDVAIVAHILHLVPDWRAALGEIHRVLKPGGMVLYLHHPATRTTSDDALGNQWEAILARYGYQMHWVGAVTEDVLGYWNERHLPLDTQFIATETRRRTVADLLQTYRDRIYSSLWRIPDDIFYQALPELEAWVADTFPDPTVEIESSYALTLTAARV
ncbi:MAG: class I SAM-dependent methyltransferase [Synechococcales bacterium]|nr:class I SAM-dependent methyltransferase [Synechococcales bacterium]